MSPTPTLGMEIAPLPKENHDPLIDLPWYRCDDMPHGDSFALNPHEDMVG